LNACFLFSRLKVLTVFFPMDGRGGDVLFFLVEVVDFFSPLMMTSLLLFFLFFPVSNLIGGVSLAAVILPFFFFFGDFRFVLASAMNPLSSFCRRRRSASPPFFPVSVTCSSERRFFLGR